MKVLLCCPDFKNDLIPNLKYGLVQSNPDCVCHVGHRIFWSAEGVYDVVHIHWEEYILSRRPPIASRFLTRLEKLKLAGSKIVLTRHNRNGHQNSKQISRSKIQALYSMLDGMIHMSRASRDEFVALPGSADLDIVHCVIPHPNYENLPNEIDSVESRKILRIPKDSNVILVFGAIRGKQEKRFVLKTFNEVKEENKLLIATGWAASNFALLDRICQKYRRNLKRTSNLRLQKAFVPTEEVQLFFNAADVVLIPRVSMSSLNSGVVPLAISFQTPVVGPNTGGIGEMIQAANCPTFSQNNSAEAAIAISKAFSIASNKQSLAQLGRISATLSRAEIGRQHHHFFKTLTKHKKT